MAALEPNEAGARPQRRFIRHTADVPIEVRTVSATSPRPHTGRDVSEGGLSFRSDEALPVGSLIEIRIPTVDPPFVAQARVVWVRSEAGQHCIGAEFLDAAAAFRVRMVEQICAIEQFRGRLREEEGRELTREEAAREWIRRYAGRFPAGETA